jgi:predicted ABC-type ATPase
MAPAKSTFLENLGAVFSEIVRPDEFALRLAPDAPESAALSAGKLAVNRMQELLARRESFAVETTRSGRLHQAIAHKAKYDGWQVRLVYIGLANAQLAIGRVHQRRLSGGHDVPGVDIVGRYARSLENLPRWLPIADSITILDNSSPTKKMGRVLAIDKRRVVYRSRRVPKWIPEAVLLLR